MRCNLKQDRIQVKRVPYSSGSKIVILAAVWKKFLYGGFFMDGKVLKIKLKKFLIPNERSAIIQT